jgi:hypothetical protein
VQRVLELREISMGERCIEAWLARMLAFAEGVEPLDAKGALVGRR